MKPFNKNKSRSIEIIIISITIPALMALSFMAGRLFQQLISEPVREVSVDVVNTENNEADAHGGLADITAYCLNGQPMASGLMPYSGAVANNQYPLGTKVEIAGKIYVVEDRMAERFPERWDIWFPSCSQAIEWGVRRLPVKIIN